MAGKRNGEKAELAPRNGRGRPTALTPQVQKGICASIAAGCYVETAVQLAGISRRVFYDWLKRGHSGEEPFAEFLHTVQVAISSSERDAIKLVKITDPKWWLGHRFRDRWGSSERRDEPQKPEIPEATGAAFDPSLLTVPELKRLTELGAEVQELHDKGLPADAIEAEFTAISDKATSNGKGEAG